jgi:hypothetical protein
VRRTSSASLKGTLPTIKTPLVNRSIIVFLSAAGAPAFQGTSFLTPELFTMQTGGSVARRVLYHRPAKEQSRPDDGNNPQQSGQDVKLISAFSRFM